MLLLLLVGFISAVLVIIALVARSLLVGAVVAAVVAVMTYTFRSVLLGAMDQLARLPFLQPKQAFFFRGIRDSSLTEFRRPLDYVWSDDYRRPVLSDVQVESSKEEIYSFRSPAADWLPEESKRGYFQLVRAKGERRSERWAIHLAATGDEGFGLRRKHIAQPLAERGVNSLILQIPYYGRRRTRPMKSYSLPFVEDVPAQAIGCVLEAVAALDHLKTTESAKGPFAFVGQSFGASMATLTSTICTEPHGVVAACAAMGPREPFINGILASRVHSSVDRSDLERALSLVDIRSNPIPKSDEPRRLHFIFARHDAFVPMADTKELIDVFREVGGVEIEETEVAGGHATTLLGRTGLYIDSIDKMLAARV